MCQDHACVRLAPTTATEFGQNRCRNASCLVTMELLQMVARSVLPVSDVQVRRRAVYSAAFDILLAALRAAT